MNEFPATWFGAPEAQHVRLADAQDEHLEHAKDVVLDKLQLATTDHNGKRLNERKWRWAMNLIGGL